MFGVNTTNLFWGLQHVFQTGGHLGVEGVAWCSMCAFELAIVLGRLYCQRDKAAFARKKSHHCWV